MQRKRMPGKRWRGGVTGWMEDMSRSLRNLREALVDSPESLTERRDLILSDCSFASTRFRLGLYETWLDNRQEARILFAEAARATKALLAYWLPTVIDTHTNYTRPAEIGAMAASLAGDTQLARELYSQAELLATDLVANDATAPYNYFTALDHITGSRPFIRAWCLIRLGRFSGFNGYHFTVPLERARKAAPVWGPSDIHQLLHTARLCFDLWRPQRGGDDYLKLKKFEPLLHSLVACLSPSAGERERLAARKALQSYQDSIHDLYYFYEIYPRVLDLQAAYPHIFG